MIYSENTLTKSHIKVTIILHKIIEYNLLSGYESHLNHAKFISLDVLKIKNITNENLAMSYTPLNIYK